MAEQLEKKKRDRPSKEQLRALVRYVEANGQHMISGVITSTNVHLWNDVTATLNSIVGGVVRERKAWVTCWKDMKSRALQKRTLLIKAKDEDEPAPLTEDNECILEILDRFNASNSSNNVRERSPLKIMQPPTPSTAAKNQSSAMEPLPLPTRQRKSMGRENLSPSISAAKPQKKGNFRAFGFLMNARNEDLETKKPQCKKPTVCDTSTKKNGNPTERTQTALEAVKVQNKLINTCAKLLIDCFKKQTIILKDGLAMISKSIESGKIEDEVEIKDEAEATAIQVKHEEEKTMYNLDNNTFISNISFIDGDSAEIFKDDPLNILENEEFNDSDITMLDFEEL